MKADISATDPLVEPAAAARGGLYRLLARIWLREADRQFVDALRSAPLSAAYTKAGGVLPGDSDAAIEQLALDYCQLFIGPSGHLPPYQSVFEQGQFQSQSPASVRRFIEVSSYQPDRDSGELMLDHLGVELDLMGFLLGRLSTQLHDREIAQGLLEISSAFYLSHLTWPEELLASAAARAQTEFYRSAVLLTKSFLRCEAERFAG